MALASFFYQRQPRPPLRPLVGVQKGQSVTRYRLFERVLSYRNDRRATATLLLPRIEEIDAAAIVVQAHNDDPVHSRTVWFEIDGMGGYLGALRLVEKKDDRGRPVPPT